MDLVTNVAFQTRKAWTAASASKTFYGKLYGAMFQQERLLLPGVDLQILLERAKDAFAIFNTNDYLKPKVVIEDAELYLLAVKINPALLQFHAEQLARNVPVTYELSKVELLIVAAAKDIKVMKSEDLFYGKVPTFMVMAMVSTAAFHGDYKLNPFNFKHYSMTFFNV